MYHGLSSLLISVLKWPNRSPASGFPALRHRRLRGEQLETRYALAGDVLLTEDPLLVMDPAPLPAVESPPLADAPVDQTSDPLAVPPPDPTPIQPPDTTIVNAPPVINDFFFTTDGNWITIQGLVTDDQDPTGYFVNISGVIAVSVSVGEDNTFRYTFQVTPEFSGSIFAQTQDIYGLYSNIATVTV